MKYTKIKPMGIRMGLGTYDTWFNKERYSTMEEALEANDAAVVDFVQDEDGNIHFEIYHTKDPAGKRHYRLEIQHFIPGLGIDAFDDDAAWRLAVKMLQFF